MAYINPSIVDVRANMNTLRYAEMLRVILPRTEQEPAACDANTPGNWSNERLRQWIDQNSGDPPISSSLLAPTETGLQLLHLTDHEFEARSMMTPGINIEQAKAFRSKIWQLHVSSRQTLLPSDASDTKKVSHADSIAVNVQSSSHEPDHKTALRPFKERIRPGTVVNWTPRLGFPWTLAGVSNKALVLCPAEAVESTAKDVFGNKVNKKRSNGGVTGEAKQYLCSMIVPGPMSETYILKLWQQVVIDAGMMDAEVCMEYDEAMRYYYMVF